MMDAAARLLLSLTLPVAGAGPRPAQSLPQWRAGARSWFEQFHARLCSEQRHMAFPVAHHPADFRPASISIDPQRL
jgi:hypothetical protein